MLDVEILIRAAAFLNDILLASPLYAIGASEVYLFASYW